MWLCNITALLALFLTIRFQQTLFEVFFFFAWSGDLFTLLIWPNPVSPPLETYPLSWAGFILKHSAPLALTILLIKQGHRLSQKAFISAITYILIYLGFIVIYNQMFDQNLLDLRYPSLDFMKWFGPWPYYVLVNFAIALVWFIAIFLISKRLKLVEVS